MLEEASVQALSAVAARAFSFTAHLTIYSVSAHYYHTGFHVFDFSFVVIPVFIYLSIFIAPEIEIWKECGEADGAYGENQPHAKRKLSRKEV